MADVRRIYVEKKLPYAVAAKELYTELKTYLNLDGLKSVRILMRYDIENIKEETYQMAKGTVFSEPPVDNLYEETFEIEDNALGFSVEYLPGQFDQRADSATQCIKLLNEIEEPTIHTATTYVFQGNITIEELERVKSYCINPVDSRMSEEDKPRTLITPEEEIEDVEIVQGFIESDETEFADIFTSLNLAMTKDDLLHIREYFKEEKRNPTITEIKVLDTYWSDHCRHTTFLTELTEVGFETGYYSDRFLLTYEDYMKNHKELYKGKLDRYVSLMDIALIAMKKLKKEGKLSDLEESDEINACSIVVPVMVDGNEEEWLVFFKNETHNHPTEIEPFGGAATCLGGAIRDPLSGRGYVYQAMRITGAADPRVSLEETLKGKLPQRKIVTGAAKGYSSYGNQIGLATGYVDEVYHPHYVAKRMEIGAVMGAAPRKNVARLNSDPGDIIILLGGRTGRDGLGGATGSSKVHTESSIDTCGAEVQKGNPPTERKLQRLFRREEVSKRIKKCNDFGAGGVSVAIGELADGLVINLDKVLKKYAGLDGTELAISESQERMAVVVDKKDVDLMLGYTREENLEAVVVAHVTEEKRLVITWRDKEIVNITREFLDTNGAHQEASVYVTNPDKEKNYFVLSSQLNKQLEMEYTSVKDTISNNIVMNNTNISDTNSRNRDISIESRWITMLNDLNVCSKKGLNLMFDSSIGANSVLLPFGGKNQLTPIQTMISKVPVIEGETNTITRMSYGFDPYLSSWSPYHGAVYAILSSVHKIVASGGDYRKIRFTFQEYFKRLGKEASRWGEPFVALLGAYEAQMGLGLASIGGKDSMSGTFGEFDVPPTLVSFAVNTGTLEEVVTPELKKAGNVIIRFTVPMDDYHLPRYHELKVMYEQIYELAVGNKVQSAYALDKKGIAEAISKMAFGNDLGVIVSDEIREVELFAPDYCGILLEVTEEVEKELRSKYDYIVVGNVTEDRSIRYKEMKLSLDIAIDAWEKPLESVFPRKVKGNKSSEDNKGILQYNGINDTISGFVDTIFDVKIHEDKLKSNVYISKEEHKKPKVVIPVFPGTNCEYDSKRAFELAGARVETMVFKNTTAEDVRESVIAYEKAIEDAQILMFAGGFSAGDEPDGSGKFIATAFRNPRLQDAVHDLLQQRDGLALGICNGFQALIKLGLVPYGAITPQKEDSPTLTTNQIGRHISKYVYTKVVSNKSPWLSRAELGGIYTVPTSHGEGRFVASGEWIEKLVNNGQVATRYVTENGTPTMLDENNPNGSYYAIEGITSPCGRVLGKMTHSERIGNGVGLNITGNKDQQIFLSGIEYFR